MNEPDLETSAIPTTSESTSFFDQNRLWLLSFGLVFITIALLLFIWSSWIIWKLAHEAQCAWYRERLASDKPSEVISAAHALSSYPTEAIWLVMRWAELRKIEKKKKTDDPDWKDIHQQTKAIQDALKAMKSRWSIVFLPLNDWYKYYKIEIKEMHGVKKLGYQVRYGIVWLFDTFSHIVHLILCGQWANTLQVPYEIAKGARLDQLTLSIDIGDIDLSGAYMKFSNFSGIGLQKATLRWAKLHHASLASAELHYAYLHKAKLNHANLEYADLQNADLGYAEPQHAKLFWTELYGVQLLSIPFLSYALAQKAKITKKQIDIVNKWNDKHPDAAWLEKGWKHWSYYDSKKDFAQIKQEQTKAMNAYIEKLKKNNELWVYMEDEEEAN